MAKSGQEEQANPSRASGFVISRDSIQRSGRDPVYRQIYRSIREAILAGTFPNGARLPSSRSLATQLGLSRTTVDLAYGLLAGDGLTQGNTAKGTVVTSGANRRGAAPAPMAGAGVGHRAGPWPLQPDCCAIDLFPRKVWSRLAARHAKALLQEDLLAHEPAGIQRLREAIANRVRLVRGMPCDAAQVFVTNGAGGAMLLAARALGASSDDVAGEEALMAPALGRALRLLGIRPNPADGAGSAIAIHSSLQFALDGVAIDDGLRQRLAARRAWLIEEDLDDDLFEPGPHEAILARGPTQQRTVYLGSFERAIFPAVGCAFVVAPSSLASRFAEAASAMPWQVPLGLQKVVCDFITQGYIGRHANRLRRAHAERRERLLAALRTGRVTRRLAFTPIGSCLVAGLDDARDASRLAAALRAGALGARLLAGRGGRGPLLLVGYAGATGEAIPDAVESLNGLLAGVEVPA
ncbi:MAG: PLP-dependent aminotransferase family protein [Lautropia sp.]